MIRKYYVWKLIVDEDTLAPTNYNDPMARFITPNSDPMRYENPMDLMFESPTLAVQGLVDHECLDQALEENWVLCIEEVTIAISDWKSLVEQIT